MATRRAGNFHGRANSSAPAICLEASANVQETRATPILSLPEYAFFAWCHANPDTAPAFAAEVLPVLTTCWPGDPDRELHPRMVRPLLELGAKEEVLHAAGCNIGSFIWSGSLTSYYALFLELLEGLYSHPTSQVHRWAKYMCRQLEDRREAAKFEDEERMAYGEI